MKYFYAFLGIFNPIFIIFYFLTGLKQPEKKKKTNQNEWTITIR